MKNTDIPLSPEFKKKLKDVKSNFHYDSITITKQGKMYVSRFMMWQKRKRELIIEVTYSKPELPELENSIINFLSKLSK